MNKSYSYSWKQQAATRMLPFRILFLIFLIKTSSASSSNLVNNDLVYQDIGLLRDENKDQNKEISRLKEMIESQDKRFHEKIIEELDKRLKYDESSIAGADPQYSPERVRQKRPYRLIPAQKNRLDENEKEEKSTILKQHQNNIITFYGPPTNCSDLSRLGYTLNGYYLVKSDDAISSKEVTNLKGIYCAFKQLEGSFSSSTIEKQIGFLKLIDGNQSEPSEGAFNPIGMVTQSIPSPRMTNLINGMGKCLAITRDSSSSNSNLIQWDCNQHQKGMLWSWNKVPFGSGDRHLCNGFGKCAASPKNSPSTGDLVQWDHFDEEGQRFQFLDAPGRPGFYLVKNDHGKCLAVRENKNRSGAKVYASDCKATEAGQHWKWSKY